jgi:hypothetical protein
MIDTVLFDPERKKTKGGLGTYPNPPFVFSAATPAAI